MPGIDYVSAINVHICRSVVPGMSAAYENQVLVSRYLLFLDKIKGTSCPSVDFKSSSNFSASFYATETLFQFYKFGTWIDEENFVTCDETLDKKRCDWPGQTIKKARVYV